MLSTIVNSADWEEVEQIMEEKMQSILLDYKFSEKGMAEIAQESMANYKAYNLLKDFLSDMGFHKGTAKPPAKRSFR